MTDVLKILHLEDLDTDAELVERELKKQSIVFSKVVVDNRPDFIKSLQDFSPDIILSDHSLPSFNSAEALKILREAGINIPFILVTGTVSEEFAVEMMKQGISDYILKSSLHRLPSSIIRAVENREMQMKKESAERDILQMNKELKDLSAHLQNIREEERALISRELHDELGQQLVRLKMDIIWLSSKIGDESDEIKDKISSSIMLVDETVETMRRINTALRPKILDDFGLFAAIEWHTSEFSKHSGIPCRLKIEGVEPEFSKLLSIHIFRIHQEALTNIARYAQATEVITELNSVDGQMIMSVRDNGIGFDTSLRKEKSFGLLGMKERADIIGAALSIDSEPGRGTRVQLTVPVTE